MTMSHAIIDTLEIFNDPSNDVSKFTSLVDIHYKFYIGDVINIHINMTNLLNEIKCSNYYVYAKYKDDHRQINFRCDLQDILKIISTLYRIVGNAEYIHEWAKLTLIRDHCNVQQQETLLKSPLVGNINQIMNLTCAEFTTCLRMIKDDHSLNLNNVTINEIYGYILNWGDTHGDSQLLPLISKKQLDAELDNILKK
jgi:hypothetical protein